MVDRSLRTIDNKYEQLLENNKIALNIFKIDGEEPGDGSDENGFLEATLNYSIRPKPWLTGVADVDGSHTRDWILSGTEATDLASACYFRSQFNL